jgi:hypothetical protein
MVLMRFATARPMVAALQAADAVHLATDAIYLRAGAFSLRPSTFTRHRLGGKVRV